MTNVTDPQVIYLTCPRCKGKLEATPDWVRKRLEPIGKGWYMLMSGGVSCNTCGHRVTPGHAIRHHPSSVMLLRANTKRNPTRMFATTRRQSRRKSLQHAL